MRPVCIKCNCEYSIQRNGALVRLHSNCYQSGDIWKCLSCDNEVVVGFGDNFLSTDNPAEGAVVADLSGEK